MSKKIVVKWHAESPDTDIEMHLEEDRMPSEMVLVFWGRKLHNSFRPRFSTVLVYAGNSIYNVGNWSGAGCV
jgi:hypothetical protein